MARIEARILALKKAEDGGSTRAYASVTIDGEFAIKGLRVMEGGKDGLFVAMPSTKTQNGYKDIFFPVTKEARETLCKTVLSAYETTLKEGQGKGKEAAQTQNESPYEEESLTNQDEEPHPVYSGMQGM